MVCRHVLIPSTTVEPRPVLQSLDQIQDTSRPTLLDFLQRGKEIVQQKVTEIGEMKMK